MFLGIFDNFYEDWTIYDKNYRIALFQMTTAHNQSILSPRHTLVGLEFNGPVNTTKVNSSLTTLFQARLSPLSGSPVLVHILSPETDNCPS